MFIPVSLPLCAPPTPQGRTVVRVRGHGDDVNAVAYADPASPNVILTGSDDHLVKVGRKGRREEEEEKEGEEEDVKGGEEREGSRRGEERRGEARRGVGVEQGAGAGGGPPAPAASCCCRRRRGCA